MIHPTDHIEQRLAIMQSYLESHYDGDEGHVLINRLTEVSAMMAESGKLLADAEYHRNGKMVSEIITALREKFPEYTSATVQNKFINSVASYEQWLVTYADRVNRTATHQVDAMRTQLSFIKSQIGI